MNIERGTVILIELDPTVGHEQQGVRPCIAVSDPAGPQILGRVKRTLDDR